MKFGRGVVRRLVDQQVAEAGAELQAARFPGRLVDGLALLGGDIEHRAILDREGMPVGRAVHDLAGCSAWFSLT